MWESPSPDGWLTFDEGEAEAVCRLDSDGGSLDQVRRYEINLSIWS